MKKLELKNSKGEIVGNISWIPPESVTVDIPNISLVTGIKALIAEGCASGLPLRWGEIRESEGKTLRVETVEQVNITDERFLQALAEAVRRMRFAGERLFGLVRDEEANHDRV